MELAKAVELVIEDTRQSFPEISPVDAIEHTLDTLNPEDLCFNDEQDELYQAYRLVLECGDTAVFTASELS